MCGPTVICGKCGNNSCNGGAGTLADGSPCDACESAYQMMQSGDGIPLWGRLLDAWMWACEYASRCHPAYWGWLYWRKRGMPEPRPWWTFRR